jgi:hypothetical protein
MKNREVYKKTKGLLDLWLTSPQIKIGKLQLQIMITTLVATCGKR